MSAFGKAWGLAFGAAFGLVVAVPPIDAGIDSAFRYKTPPAQATKQQARDSLPEQAIAPVIAPVAPLVLPFTDAPGVGLEWLAGLHTAPESPPITGDLRINAGSTPDGTPEIAHGTALVPPIVVPATPKKFESNKPVDTPDPAQEAINLVASTESTTNVTQTTQAIQTAKEGQSPPSIDVATSAHALHASREDEAIAIIMILLESIA